MRMRNQPAKLFPRLWQSDRKCRLKEGPTIVVNSNPARRFGLTATLSQFHMVAVRLTYMYAMYARPVSPL